MTKKKLLSTANAKKAKLALLWLLIGILLGTIGTFLIQSIDHPKKDDGITPSIVFSRVIQENELVCASQMYNITEKVEDTNTFFGLFDIPFTTNSFWYRYVGTIKVAINLHDASFSTSGSVITITLPQPYISSNTPDMEKSGCLEENNNILNPIHVQDVDAFQRLCIEQSESEILQGNIMEEARESAEKNVAGMFQAALGDTYETEFKWSESE